MSITVTHNLVAEVQYSGNHAMTPGDVARWMPLSTRPTLQVTSTSCVGAAAADPAIYGGAMDTDLNTLVQLPGGVDGSDSGTYVLCLAQGVADPASLTDAAFVIHPHVTAVVVHQPPSAPPSPPP